MAERQPFDSRTFWQERYRRGGTSGAGSSGRLAVYKANVVNELCHSRNIRSVVEFGSGDGNQASLFSIERYCGVDVSEESLAACRQRFSGRDGWSFQLLDEFRAQPGRYDMAISLDVIYHLVEDAVYEAYIADLFGAAQRCVLIYSSDKTESSPSPHVRHRKYSDQIATAYPDWNERQSWQNPFAYAEGSDPTQTSFAFFRLYTKEARS